ncbi:MAG TPA: outer membrane protein assembly factor BamA [Candidatus Binatia bacterium]|nr:outer membrane protein assembly factor BamA [Candidatus Binatia bacterium]
MNLRRLLLGALLACCATAALAVEPFTIKAIRAEGLQRLDDGTVLSYLPLSVGDTLDNQTSSQAIRALYASGLFQDVQLERDGDTLVVRVAERPAISDFKIEGNDKIGGDQLKDSLKNLGLAKGEPFKRALLDQVEQELRRQYYANGYYDVGIETEVKEEGNNRVSLKIKVTEGKVTRIREINIIGNKAFSKDELLEQLKLEKTVWWVPFQSSDRYSKQQLLGDLESLGSYYQDRGYLKFNVTSVQVALSPDKEAIYITLNIEEGEIYKIKDRRFSGETVLTEDFLQRLVSTKAGDVFSRKEATESANRIEAALADIGYAFAEVQPLPEVDEDKREVGLNYFVQPGKRAYVRQINFSGNSSTNDETLRREMRQLEAAPFSKSSVERSRVRLARLPFIEEAEVDTKPVPGSDDLVDINFTVKERPPGSIQFGVGYSGASGFLVTGNVTHTNVFGSGNRVAVELDNNSISKRLSLSWTDPYFTEDGISQTASVYYRKTEGLARFASGFNLNVIGGNLTYGIPLSEYSTLRAGAGVDDTALDTFANSTANVLRFAVENGTRYITYELRTGVTYDSRNRTFFATRGALHQFDFDITTPGSDLQFYRAAYRVQNYRPLLLGAVLESNARFGVLDKWGNKGDPPPYENFLAGGARTVRGYRESSLGPRENDIPTGGRFQTALQNNFIIPTPLESDNKSTRFALFFDIGDVFQRPSDFRWNELRQSAGVAFTWYTPFLGILDLSYALPLNDKANDSTDRFQITFGTPF